MIVKTGATVGQEEKSNTQFREIGQVLPELEIVTQVILVGAGDD